MGSVGAIAVRTAVIGFAIRARGIADEAGRHAMRLGSSASANQAIAWPALAAVIYGEVDLADSARCVDLMNDAIRYVTGRHSRYPLV